MKKIKRLLAVVLSIIMAISCFTVVPVMAEDLSALPTYDGVQNVTLVNQQLNPGYDAAKLEAAGISYASLASKLEVEVNEKYGSALDNTLQLSGMGHTFVKDKMTEQGRSNLMNASNLKYQWYSDRLTNNWTVPGSADLAGQMTNGIAIDTAVSGWDQGWSPSPSAAVQFNYQYFVNTEGGVAKYSSERVAQGAYELKFKSDLGEQYEIDTFWLYGHCYPKWANATYKVFVSDYEKTLYSPQNEVFYYNAYDVHKAYNDNVGFNVIGNTTYASAVDKKSEGQYLTFGGETKPTGRYVGVIVYDTATDDVNTNGFACFADLGVMGTATGDYSLTHADKTVAGSVSWATKESNLELALGTDYKASLQMANLAGDAIYNKVGTLKNQIMTAKIQPYANKGTDTWTNLTAAEVKNITDLGYTGGSRTATGYGDANTLKTGGYNSNTYSQYGDASELTGKVRVLKDRYDALITLNLGNIIEIDKFLFVGQPNNQITPYHYSVYVGNDEATLYSDENEVFYYYYGSHQIGETYKFNDGTPRTAEMQYLEFNGDKLPTGKYLGIKVWDGSPVANNWYGALAIQDIGVYGDVSAYYFDSNNASVDTAATSTSSKKVVTAGTVDATVSVTDAEGNESGFVNAGDELTFKATCADKRYIFDGWYNGDQKVSSDAEYTFPWSGESLVAKYKTNLILRMEPAADITMKNYYGPLSNQTVFTRDQVLEMGTWKYDATEGAMYYTGLSAVGNDGVTYSMTGSAIMTQLTKGTASLLETEYEPWTTYKYSVTLKTEAPEQFKANQLVVGAAAHSMLSGNEHAIRHPYTTDGYVTYDFYFNSGAAAYDNGNSVRESKFSGNGFNMGALGDGVKVYLKELAVEKVSNVQLGETDGAVVTLANSQKFYRSVSTSVGTNDASVYGGASQLKDIANYLYDNLEDNSVIGGATDSVTFKVEPEDEFTEILSVKVNGNVVTADGEGNYTYSGTAIDDTLDLDKFVADGMTAFIIDVETERTATYPVHFADKKGNIFYTAQFAEGTVLAGSEALATAEGMIPAIYGYHFTEWDNGIDIPITSEVTYQAQYAKNADNYTVVINYVDHPVRTLENLTFDARIELNDNDASYWTINGKIFAIGTSAVAYVAGNMEFTAVESYENVAAGVTVVHDVAVANANDNTYATFARVINPEDKEIAEIGFIYITGGSYGLVGIDGFTMANLEANNIKYEHGVVPNVGTDFMVTYNGITNKQEVMRYARAYVKFQGDDQVYYSNVTSKVFNEGKVAEQ